jgi:hypothetical protein
LEALAEPLIYEKGVQKEVEFWLRDGRFILDDMLRENLDE